MGSIPLLVISPHLKRKWVKFNVALGLYNFMYVPEMDVWEATEMRKSLHGLKLVTCAVRKDGDYAAGLS
jgi:hypothetical protein